MKHEVMMKFSLLPKMLLPSITELTPEKLRECGVGLLMLDFDNTVVPYTSNEPTPAMREWLKQLPSLGIPVCVVSNSKKPRVVRFCEQYGLPCITHAKKPFSHGIRQAMEQFPHNGMAALAGDQIYTDVLGANCAGVLSILVTPIHLHSWPLRLRHQLEKPWIAMGRRRQNRHAKS